MFREMSFAFERGCLEFLLRIPAKDAKVKTETRWVLFDLMSPTVPRDDTSAYCTAFYSTPTQPPAAAAVSSRPLNFLLHGTGEANRGYNAHIDPPTHRHAATPRPSETMRSGVRDQRSLPGPNPHTQSHPSSHGSNQCYH